MDLSVVVPTLNACDRLARCLDALARDGGDAEVIVVNGPSTDGTTGMIRERGDVDVLVEIADRNANAARNAGIRAATGDAVAFLGDDVTLVPGWRDAVETAFGGGADIVAGPVLTPDDGSDAHGPERERFEGRSVTHFHGGNVVASRDALAAIDGFDEYLVVGGDRDAAHRAGSLDLRTAWAPDAAVGREPDAIRTDGLGDRDLGRKYRSLAYSLAKNYGPRPGVPGRTLRRAVGDGADAFASVLDGEFPPSRWLANGRTVARNGVRGLADGLRARYRSTPARNPHGVSSRQDRAVRTYDWR